jgi:hypothetical protein
MRKASVLGFLLVVLAAGCAGDDRVVDSRLFGVWNIDDHGEIYHCTFNKDGSFSTDLARALAGTPMPAMQGTYYVQAGELVIEGKTADGRGFREARPFYLTDHSLAVQPLSPVGTRQGIIGYWATEDGKLGYEFRDGGIVLRRQVESPDVIDTFQGSYREVRPNVLETSFGDQSLSGTLELIDDTVIAAPAFHRY